jgi:hypothetical protein
LEGRTLNTQLMDAVCARLFYNCKEGKTTALLLDDTVRPVAGAFTPACFDADHVHVLDAAGRLEDNVGSIKDQSLVQWVVGRLNCPHATTWLVRKQFVRRFKSVVTLLPVLQQPAPTDAMGGVLAQRFFSRMPASPIRAWHAGDESQHRLVLCNGQRAAGVDPAGPHTRCCCGFIAAVRGSSAADATKFSRRFCTLARTADES